MNIPLSKDHIQEGAHAVGVKTGFLTRVASMLQRSVFAGSFGTAFEGKRDYYDTFGWDRTVTADNMWEMYHRGGIAHRIIHAYPDAVWGRPPQLYIQGNPEWNASWDKLVKQTKLWSAIQRADVLARLGRYSVLLVGTNRGNLQAPLRKADTITFLQPYSEKNVRITEWETDPTSPNFGKPKTYMVYPNLRKNTFASDETTTMPVASSFKVHASRVIHMAYGCLENEVYGVPMYAPIWNYLIDLTKVVGSSSESYWLTAYRGIHANVKEDMDLNEDDAAALSDEVDEYLHGLRRVIRTRGVDVKSLGSDVADPRGAFDVLVTLISGTTKIPKRILLGSEAGQLASSQDKGNWSERVEEERANYAEPSIIIPFLAWLNEHGILETDPTTVQILWPDAYRMSPLERGQTAAQTARTIANISKGMEPVQLTPDTPAVIDPATGQETTPAIPGERGDPLITRDEARKIIGLSTDQQVLIESPM